jgi:RNA polymerase sigma factor (sigma-70 family)
MQEGMSMPTPLASARPRSDLTDEVLVHQAQRGDQDAFELLVERYSALLLPLITRIVRDEHLAHDVLQHVFLQLYRSLPILVPGRTLKAWLCQVARRCSIDELRRRRHFLFSEIEPFPVGGEYSFLASLPDLDRQPEEQVELRELRQLLLEAIATLPARYRAVVLMRYDTQLSYSEIGQALRIPANTARSRFARASKRLRTVLGSEFSYY